MQLDSPQSPRTSHSIKLRFAKLLAQLRPIEIADLIKWLFRFSYQELKIGSRTFWLDPVSHFGQRLLVHGVHERKVTEAICCLLRSGDTFVDVGANEGYFSL